MMRWTSNVKDRIRATGEHLGGNLIESHILCHHTSDGVIKYFLKVKNRSDYQICEEVLIFPNFKLIEESTHVDRFRYFNCYTIKM